MTIKLQINGCGLHQIYGSKQKLNVVEPGGHARQVRLQRVFTEDVKVMTAKVEVCQCHRLTLTVLLGLGGEGEA